MFHQLRYRCSCLVHTSRWLPICCLLRSWALSSGKRERENISLKEHKNQLRHHHVFCFLVDMNIYNNIIFLFFLWMVTKAPCQKVQPLNNLLFFLFSSSLSKITVFISSYENIIVRLKSTDILYCLFKRPEHIVIKN